MKKLLFILSVCLAVVMAAGCKNSADLDANGVPGKLLIGMYASDNPGQLKTAMEPIRLYMEKKLGMPVEYFYTTDYTAVIEALRSKKIHMAQLTPFAYVIATRKPGLTPIATLAVNGRPSMYHSIIFTTPKTGIKTMADVKAHAKDITLCFADPASTSGHLIPRAYLKSIGLDPDSAFKETIFAGNHAASILSVKSGKVDIGCSTIDLSMNKLVNEGIVKYSDFVILWTSPPILNDAITVRNDLNKAFVGKISEAYFDINKEGMAAFKGYTKLFYPHPEQMSYIAVQDSQYNGLRRIAAGIKEFKSK